MSPCVEAGADELLLVEHAWLLLVDPDRGVPREWKAKHALAAALLLDLLDAQVLRWQGDTVVLESTGALDHELVEYAVDALHGEAGTGGRLALARAVDVTYDGLWERTGAALVGRGLAERRPRPWLMPWRTPRTVPVSRELRAQAVHELRRAVLTVGPWDRRTDRLASVLWAGDVVEHGLSPKVTTDHDMVDVVGARMVPGGVAELLARPVSMLQSFVSVPRSSNYTGSYGGYV